MKCYNSEHRRYPLHQFFADAECSNILELYVDKAFMTLGSLRLNIDFSFKFNQKNLQKIAYVNKRLIQQSEKNIFTININGYNIQEAHPFIDKLLEGVCCHFSIPTCFNIVTIPTNAKIDVIQIDKITDNMSEILAYLEDILNLGFKKIRINMITQEERQKIRDYFSETELVFQTIARHSVLIIYRP